MKAALIVGGAVVVAAVLVALAVGAHQRVTDSRPPDLRITDASDPNYLELGALIP